MAIGDAKAIIDKMCYAVTLAWPMVLLAAVICKANGDLSAFVPSNRKGCGGVPRSFLVGTAVSKRASDRFLLTSARAKPSSSAGVGGVDVVNLVSTEDIIQLGKDVGVDLSFTTLGPGFRAVARSSSDDSQVLGYVEGFLRPGGQIVHMDKMEISRKAVVRARKENPEVTGPDALGLGLLLGYLCLLHGKSKGCTATEFLAIDDEEFQHKRLVKYYQLQGFKVIRYVGEDVKNIPDRLIWGGCGTLMREEVIVLLEKWTKRLFRTLKKL